MAKLSQRKVIHEAFPDMMRGLKDAMVTAAKTLAPEITNPLGRVAEPFKAMKKSYSNQQPLSVLKEYLGKKTDIEFIKLIKQEKRTANPNKSWFKKIYGPKNVTKITFTATVYHKGTVRDYKPYTEAVGRGLPRPPSTGLYKPRASEQTLDIDIEQQPQPQRLGLPQPQPQPNQSGKLQQQGEESTLTAEIFRTSEGLQVGEIYNTKTGRIYYSEKEKSLPIFNNEITNYKDPATGDYPVKNIIRFLQKVVGLNDKIAKNIVANATDLQNLIQIATGITITNINDVIPSADIDKLRAVLVPLYVENNNSKERSNKSQITLLEELSRLTN